MSFLYLLEECRVPVLNEFMLLITYLGDELAFLVTALILFWCVDKRHGYYTLSVGFIGTIFNQFLKLLCRVPRPWVLDENFTILEQAREGASGYSFPSGHTQSSVGTFGSIAAVTKNRWVRVVAIAITVLVPFSRMYIGVHTPLDVFVSVLIALGLIFGLRPLVMGNHKKTFPILLVCMSVLAVGYVCFVEFFPFPEDIDAHNMASGVKNAYTLLGSLLGLLVVYIVDEKWLNFPVKAAGWVQVVKVLLGLCLVLAVKEGLSSPLSALLGASVGRAVRYFLIVITAGVLWPLSFKWFSRISDKPENKR